ncbi:MAG: nuclear transport factor 2 family protein [Thermoleophilaceae bacterium]
MPTNAEIVTRSFEGFDKADMEKFTSDWAPDIVFDTSHYEFWPLEQTEFHGAEEVVFIFGQFMSNVRSLEVHDLVVTEVDPDHVLATYDEVRRNKGEDDPVRLAIGIVYSLRDEQIAHVWVFTDQRRAEKFSREVSG